jgi:hypothetical protein
MADIVDLRSRQPTSHEDEFNSELVQDLARYSEGLATEKDIRRRYRFDDAVWEGLGSNDSLLAAIEDEKTRRIRSGALKRERAQVLVTQAPDVLGEILLDKNASPKHRLDSAKALDGFAVGGPEGAGAPAADRFQITINLGSDVLYFDKAIAVDTDPLNNTDTTPQEEWLPVIAANKKDDGGGQGHI